ncbi:hypothetical protein ABZY19_12395 [Streptomyces sp. NPDC006475]|uniref:hypothetical protein n=1 Tax=Streptomyces sp. NPDC006475 TaxID=3155719 RepID=UPI0033B08BA7
MGKDFHYGEYVVSSIDFLVEPGTQPHQTSRLDDSHHPPHKPGHLVSTSHPE